MRLTDGRFFHVAQSFCIGKGGPGFCEWNSAHAKRLYDHFVVFARSYDGAVRGFDLYPTSRDSYRAAGINVVGHDTSPAHFNRFYGSLAAALARRELTKGCAPNQP
jgi:hypothetical protein